MAQSDPVQELDPALVQAYRLDQEPLTWLREQFATWESWGQTLDIPGAPSYQVEQAAPADPIAPVESFAPPIPPVLPEIVIRAPRVPAAPPPWGFGAAVTRTVVTIGEAIARLAVPLFGLVFPAPGGGYDEVQDLPLDFRVPPRKPPPRVPVPLDPIMPPNWEDLANEPDWFGGQRQPAPRLPRRPRFDFWDSDPDVGPSVGLDFDFGDYRAPRINLPLPRVSPGDPIADPRRPFAPDFLPFSPTYPGIDPLRIDYPQPGTAAPPVRVTQPIADPVPTLVGDPFAPPRYAPRPITPPAIPGQPWATPFSPPTLIRDPFADPQPFQFAQPKRDPKDKDCRCPKEKKKKKKKRKPRTVCYAGSYRERAKGLQKRKREQIPCA